MSIGTILAPTAESLDLGNSAGTPLGVLAGRSVGLRQDSYWKSWDWVTEEWGTLLERDGARVSYWRHTPPIGKESDAIHAARADFAANVEAVVVGLCNCGACTMWSVDDALTFLAAEKLTVMVATDQFEGLVRTLAAQGGRPSINVQLLPYPLEGKPEEDVREIARSHYPALLRTMGATV